MPEAIWISFELELGTFTSFTGILRHRIVPQGLSVLFAGHDVCFCVGPLVAGFRVVFCCFWGEERHPVMLEYMGTGP